MPTLVRKFKAGITPCELYSCNFCKGKKLACISYRAYAAGNEVFLPETPTRAMYDWIFSGVEDER